MKKFGEKAKERVRTAMLEKDAKVERERSEKKTISHEKKVRNQEDIP